MVDFFGLPHYPVALRGNGAVPWPYGAQFAPGWTWRGYARALKRGEQASGKHRVLAVHTRGGKRKLYRST